MLQRITRLASLSLAFAIAPQLLGAQPSVTAPVNQPVQSPTSRGWETVTPAVQPIKVVVSIAPLRGLIEPLLPPGSTVDLLIPPGVSEHGYEIPPAKLAALSRADLVVLVGMGLEGAAEEFVKASQKPGDGRAVIVWEQLLKDRKVNLVPNPKPAAEQDHDHKGEKEADHKHNHAESESCSACAAAGYRGDPHVWLDPIEAGYLVIAVADKIEQMRPVDVSTRRHPVQGIADSNLLGLADLHFRFASLLGDIDPSVRQKPIIVGHNAFDWFAKRYNLNFLAVSGLNATEPTPADLRRVTQAVKEHKLSMIFTEPQISPKAVQRISEITGAKVAMIDPLGSGDYRQLMESNMRLVLDSLGSKADVHIRMNGQLGLWNRPQTASFTAPAAAKP